MLSACAKVGPPEPPLVSVPSATQELDLVKAGERVRLVFPIPDADIQTVLIYTQCGPEAPWGDNLAPVARTAVAALERVSETGKFLFEQVDAPPGCRYSIRFENGRRRLSPFSNVREAAGPPAPRPPRDLKGEVFEDRIVVTWTPPTMDVTGGLCNVMGYLVNSQHEVSVPRFEDREFRFGQASAYTVQAVSRFEPPLTLSDPSPELVVTPVDVFGPPSPRGLVGLYSSGKVRLVWEETNAKDLKGYRVYRGLDPASMSPIADLGKENSYTDETPSPEDRIYYQVSAIDETGNEGPRSAATRIERTQP